MMLRRPSSWQRASPNPAWKSRNLLTEKVWHAHVPPILLTYAHPDLPPIIPHLRAHAAGDHRHALVIDELQAHWPDRHALVR